jgi:ABC transporter family protein
MIGRLLGLSRSDARARASELLARFELADAAGRPAKTYSGGMRRRLDLTASLVGNPRVLYLDEPTTGLDLPARVRQQPARADGDDARLAASLREGSIRLPTSAKPSVAYSPAARSPPQPSGRCSGRSASSSSSSSSPRWRSAPDAAGPNRAARHRQDDAHTRVQQGLPSRRRLSPCRRRAGGA